MKCKDCQKSISKKTAIIINVMEGSNKVTSFYVCSECAAIYKVFVELSEKLGEEKLIKLLRETLKDEHK